MKTDVVNEKTNEIKSKMRNNIRRDDDNNEIVIKPRISIIKRRIITKSCAIPNL